MNICNKSQHRALLLISSLCLALPGCENIAGSSTSEPSPYPTNIQPGDWSYTLALVDGNNACNIPAVSSNSAQAFSVIVPDIWTRAWDMSVLLNLDPGVGVDSEVQFNCESTDGLTFQCAGKTETSYQPDSSKDATIPVSHSASGSFGTSVSFCGNYSDLLIEWDLSVTGACQGVDCNDVWPETTPPCTSQLHLSSIWMPMANGESGCY